MTEPMTKEEALKLIKALKKKWQAIDDQRRTTSYSRYTTADILTVNHLDLFSLLQDLEKLEKRVEWGI